ncbi:S-adenosyl-L-methionine-dependent methyltransferase [Sparassis latifolia]
MTPLVAPGSRRLAQRCTRPLSARFSTTARAHNGSSSRKKTPRDHLNYNPQISFSDTPDPEHVNYRRVTSNDLEEESDPPRRVKMLVRDYIENSLYHPHYGYFTKQANIFSTPQPLEFGALRSSIEFQAVVAKRYAGYGRGSVGPGVQLWHTPTEIFKPHYGNAIGQALVSEYLLKYFPYEDFVIYEIGAGNGTMALDILNYVQAEYPDVYDRTKYNIIEISDNLARIQREKLSAVHPCVNVMHKSIFHWNTREPAPSFFLAMEVIDNFAHDMIRYDLRTLEPYQGLVTIDGNSDYSTYYTRVTDPLISSFLALRRRLMHAPPIPRLLKASSTFRSFYTNLPFAPNLSAPEYIPTRLLSLLRTLRRHFPRHHLLLSDFSSLPETIPGVNAPRVQTRVGDEMVTCGTLLVNPGYFDIFFPTDFERLRDLYEHVLSEPLSMSASESPPRASPLSTTSSSLFVGTDFFSSYHPRNRRPPVDDVASASGLPVGDRKSRVLTHEEFMETYADLSKTRVRNGENPLVEFYKNVKFLF